MILTENMVSTLKIISESNNPVNQKEISKLMGKGENPVGVWIKALKNVFLIREFPVKLKGKYYVCTEKGKKYVELFKQMNSLFEGEN